MKKIIIYYVLLVVSNFAIGQEDVVEVFNIVAIPNATVNENELYTGPIPTLTGDAPIGVIYTKGGSDSEKFTIDSLTGVVRMAVKDFENPVDAGGNNTYDIEITAADNDGNIASTSWTVEVTDQQEQSNFSITQIPNATVNENDTYTGPTPTLTGDAPIGVLTYTKGGSDSEKFTIDSLTGVVSMVGKDYENRTDADTNNTYEIGITARDSDANTATTSWTVEVTDQQEQSNFSITQIPNATVNENDTYTGPTPTLTGETPIGVLTYTKGGSDSEKFTIDSLTGVVSMVGKDYENRTDADTNNTYEIGITATDSDANTATTSWTVEVTDQQEQSNFSITQIPNATVNENETYTGPTPTLTGDAPIGVLTYTKGGSDSEKFTINSLTGVVSMVGKDYENRTDADTNNTYEIGITATDSDANTATTSWTVEVTDQQEQSNFSITQIPNATVNENDTYTGPTPTLTGETPIGVLTYTKGGSDSEKFTIDSLTGVVRMAVKDFENPVDADTNNTYEIGITATDSDANTATTSWTVEVTDQQEQSNFSITQIPNATVNENDTYTGPTPTLTGDAPIGVLTYTKGGSDSEKFTIDSLTGVVSMVGKDYENRTDADTNNTYEIGITATDSDANTATTSWTVEVTDQQEQSNFSITQIPNATVNENDTYTGPTPTLTGETPIGVLTYTKGGSDSEKFTIDSLTGVVRMAVKDFENPVDADTNNTYEIGITARDNDGNIASTSWTVEVTDQQEQSNFSITQIPNATVNENDTYTGPTPTLTGETPIGVLTYTKGGSDSEKFTIDSLTGVVRMAVKDFENPVDADTNNTYEIGITARDNDGNIASTSWTVEVTDQQEQSNFSITQIPNATVNENDTYTGPTPTLTGETPIGVLTYTKGGSDSEKFTIDSLTGVVRMAVKDFENPVDADTNNTYEIGITARDNDGNIASTSWTVEVTDQQEQSNFSITQIPNATVNENDTYTGPTPTLTGETPIGVLTYTKGGSDSEKFTIDSLTGVVRMAVKDFENPVDADTNNTYEIGITARDNDGNIASTSWTVEVTDDNGEGQDFVIETAINNQTVVENNQYSFDFKTLITEWTHIGELTYTLNEGADKTHFTINPSTGIVSMEAKDYEAPQDADTNNTYDIEITATDSDGNIASTSWTVEVTDQQEQSNFSITQIPNATVNENESYSGSIPTLTGETPIGVLTYTKGGSDSEKFTINSLTGVVSMEAKDYEAPQDADTNNTYDIEITARDNDGNIASTSWTVGVTDDNGEGQDFVIETAINNQTVVENNQYSFDFKTLITEWTHIGELTYTLNEGADKTHFTINPSTGIVSMEAKDYEAPQDADTNNTYDIEITATDSDGNIASTSWTVGVTDDNGEGQDFVIETAINNQTVVENNQYSFDFKTLITEWTHIGELTYTLNEGADKTHFTINPSTGIVSMEAKDYEAPQDADTNNTYDIEITATDSDGNIASTSWTVGVTDDNGEGQDFVIETAINNQTVVENNQYSFDFKTLITEWTHIGELTYTLNEGADKTHFTINPSTGIVSMEAKDYEAPQDADTNNTYDIEITATDSDGNIASTSWTVEVTDQQEQSNFSITQIPNATVNENEPYSGSIPTLTGETPIGVLTYTKGGSDKDLFRIDSSTGVVFMFVKDYENPTDADTKNTYEIEITATDRDDNIATTSWTVEVTDQQEQSNFSITQIPNATVNKNEPYTGPIPTLTGETPIGVLTYTKGGSDSEKFTIDSSTGVVSMVGKDYENPTDADTNNTYEIGITATDSDDNTATASWVVTVEDINEEAVFEITAISDDTVNENAIYTRPTPTFINGTAPVRFTVSGVGADKDLFAIDPSTGVVFMFGKDYENPTDADTKNTYEIEITATDRDDNIATASWVVTVEDVNEEAVFEITTIPNATVNENESYTGPIPTLTGDTPIGVLTYTKGGSDSEKFTIDSLTGVVSMVGKDYENPTDAGENNTYEIGITATDSDDNTATASWVVTVEDVNEEAVFEITTIPNTTVNENESYTGPIPTLTGDTPIGVLTYTKGIVVISNTASSFTSSTVTTQLAVAILSSLSVAVISISYVFFVSASVGFS